MTRNRKSLEEQLAEVHAKQAQVKARLAALESRRRARDHRLRGHGERVLLRLMLQRIKDEPAFADATRRSIATAGLRPNEREAILWLMDVNESEAGDDAAVGAQDDVAASAVR